MQMLKGHLLIASPQLDSPIFGRSVILVIEQNEDGALGVIVNQQINTTLTELSGKDLSRGFRVGQAAFPGRPHGQLAHDAAYQRSSC